MKRVIAFIMTILMSVSIASEVFAANVCYQISGYCDAERTFTVETKNRPILSEKITLKQSKGKYEYRPMIGSGKKTKSGYMAYKVYYKKSSDKSWKSKKWTGEKCTLTLKKNSTYSVRVVPYSKSALSVQFKGSNIKWKKLATWEVSSTKGIDLCK
ncbi:MAG: hypothetical protein IJW15_00605 [Clostridia bacterium]|nr:hypothetical protein [Clostridia bacterium]